MDVELLEAFAARSEFRGTDHDWRAFQERSAADRTLFGAFSYYTYLTRRPG
jgi:hypothetical protein